MNSVTCLVIDDVIWMHAKDIQEHAHHIVTLLPILFHIVSMFKNGYQNFQLEKLEN